MTPRPHRAALAGLLAGLALLAACSPATSPQASDMTLGTPPASLDQTTFRIDAPAWGGSLPSGGHVSGLANAFEAQFSLMVLDAGGRALLDMPVMASCGSGCWGTFDVAVDYTVTEAQQGTLRVFELSAADGSPIHVVDYPVWLTP